MKALAEKLAKLFLVLLFLIGIEGIEMYMLQYHIRICFQMQRQLDARLRVVKSQN